MQFYNIQIVFECIEFVRWNKVRNGIVILPTLEFFNFVFSVSYSISTFLFYFNVKFIWDSLKEFFTEYQEFMQLYIMHFSFWETWISWMKWIHYFVSDWIFRLSFSDLNEPNAQLEPDSTNIKFIYSAEA